MSSMPFWQKTTLAPVARTLSATALICSLSLSMNIWNWSEEVILISALVSVSLASMATMRMAILAFSTLSGMFLWTLCLSTMRPSKSSESSRLSPTFFSRLMASISKTILPFLSSTAFRTRSTAYSGSLPSTDSAHLPVMAVLEILISISL